jgi:HTH-type transcriptional regulator / antitoxin HipB
MSDLQAYISDRKKRDPEFAEGYDEGFRSFKIGVLLKQAREEAGLTQDELAKQLNTKKTAISRIENHAEDIRLSTLRSMPRHLVKSSELNSWNEAGITNGSCDR